MKQLICIVVIFNIAIWNNFALASECKDSVVLLQKGDPSPCTGFLYSPNADQQAASDHEDAKYYKLVNEKLVFRQELMNKQNEILDKRLKLYMDQSLTLSKELNRQESVSTLKQIGWFLLGVGITGLAVHGAGQLK